MTGARDERREVNRLCLGGDWASAHGDIETLGYIAKQLAACAGPLHREFVALADLCAVAPDRASKLWATLRTKVLRDSPTVA